MLCMKTPTRTFEDVENVSNIRSMLTYMLNNNTIDAYSLREHMHMSQRASEFQTTCSKCV